MSCRLSAASAQTHPSMTARTDAARQHTRRQLSCLTSEVLQKKHLWKRPIRESLGQGSKGDHVKIWGTVWGSGCQTHLLFAEKLDFDFRIAHKNVCDLDGVCTGQDCGHQRKWISCRPVLLPRGYVSAHQWADVTIKTRQAQRQKEAPIIPGCCFTALDLEPRESPLESSSPCLVSPLPSDLQ